MYTGCLAITQTQAEIRDVIKRNTTEGADTRARLAAGRSNDTHTHTHTRVQTQEIGEEYMPAASLVGRRPDP